MVMTKMESNVKVSAFDYVVAIRIAGMKKILTLSRELFYVAVPS